MVSNEKDENFYLHLLEKFISDPDLIELEQNLKTFNLMRIFKISTLETATSAFLRWLLDPNEDHGIGDYFLRYFLMECANSTNEFNLIEIDGLQLEKAIVRTEENFWGKKVDITIRVDNNDFLCLIENKIKSNEGIAQTKSYVRLSEKKYQNYKIMYIYLTPSGDQAEASDFFLSLSYHQIKKLLNQTIKAKKHLLNEEILFILEQFLLNMEVNILDEGKIREWCEEIYERHKDAIETIIKFKPEFMNIIGSELQLLLGDEWDIHPTKGTCYIYKKKWLTVFNEFFTNVPFFNYYIRSGSTKEGKIFIDVYFNVEKPKIIEIRTIFSEVLDKVIEDHPPKNFRYNKNTIAYKITKRALDNGYETKDDLKVVAKFIKNFIDDTLLPIEMCIETFKKTNLTQIKNWKSQLTSS